MILVPTAPWTHLAFDLIAWSSGAALGVAVYRWRLGAAIRATATKVDGGYFAFLTGGAAVGAWAAGSLN